jgi:Flp pilus assembly protein TadG
MMKELKARLRSNREGATAVEFAIILPVLLLILMGLIDFAMALHTKNTLQYAVERAARYAIVNQSGSTGSFSTEVTTHLAGIIDDSSVSITVTPQSADGMNFVFIEASQTYNFTLPFISYLGGVSIAGNTRVPLVDE